MSGKGDKRRPCLVSRKVFEDNWNKVFGQSKLLPIDKRSKKKKKRTKKVL